jgi:hypothetical protein
LREARSLASAKTFSCCFFSFFRKSLIFLAPSASATIVAHSQNARMLNLQAEVPHRFGSFAKACGLGRCHCRKLVRSRNTDSSQNRGSMGHLMLCLPVHIGLFVSTSIRFSSAGTAPLSA